MKLIKALFVIPALVFLSPALLLLALFIFITNTDRGPMRSILSWEIRSHGLPDGFKRFMQVVFVPACRYQIQSFVLGAAGFLVVVVGLRGLGAIAVEFVYVALAVEFTLLALWAITVFYTVDEPSPEKAAARTAPPPVPAKDPELVEAVRELSTHMAFLERRLAGAEIKFENLGKLDGAMQTLSARLNLLVGDQFNLRVKQEFDLLIAQLARRAQTPYGDDTPPPASAKE
jgi:hypothetical protein